MTHSGIPSGLQPILDQMRRLQSVARPLDLSPPPLPPLRVPSFVTANDVAAYQAAIITAIDDYFTRIGEEFNVGLAFGTPAADPTFILREVHVRQPMLLLFRGETVDHRDVELLMHVHQLTLWMQPVRREDPAKPRRPIGFHVDAPPGPAAESDPPPAAP